MKRDQEIFDLIEREHQRQLKGMELIASENFVSDEVMQAMGSYLTNKYAEGLPGKRYYGGCQVVDQVEDLARERVKKLFGAEFANVQPHSGAQANAAVLLAVLKPGDTFMGLNLDHGGHLRYSLQASWLQPQQRDRSCRLRRDGAPGIGTQAKTHHWWRFSI